MENISVNSNYDNDPGYNLTTSNQDIRESKLIRAKTLQGIMDKANRYADGRPATFGKIQKIEGYFVIQVGILCWGSSTTNYYLPWPRYHWQFSCGGRVWGDATCTCTNGNTLKLNTSDQFTV
jgi:hypothetical protein